MLKPMWMYTRTIICYRSKKKSLVKTYSCQTFLKKIIVFEQEISKTSIRLSHLIKLYSERTDGDGIQFNDSCATFSSNIPLDVGLYKQIYSDCPTDQRSSLKKSNEA